LTAGQFYNNGSSTNALSEKSISYDKAGNITALSRYNNSGAATSLAYSYTGNRRNNYSYDVNGNVTSDVTNSLQSSYNLINLPAQIKSGSTVKANYSYLSDGTKAAAFTSASAGKDYAGSFTYSRGDGGLKTLESVAFGGGRIRRTGNNAYAVDYHITDHLGSVRAIVNASGTVVEQNDYYPFGMRHPNGLTQLAANRWRFSGKEEQDAAFGIGYSDFGARFYDRSAAWTAIDPMAENYFPVSPYAYCAGNPIKLIDHDGGVIRLANNKTKALDYLAQIAATSVGKSIVTELISSPKTATFIALLFPVEFNPTHGWISYCNNQLFRNVDGGIMTPMLSFAHEMMHTYDSFWGQTKYRSYTEENAVSFANYIRENYSLKPQREHYGAFTEGDFHKFQSVGKDERISNFSLVYSSVDNKTRGYQYTRTIRTATKWVRRIPVDYAETSEVGYIILTIDDNKHVKMSRYETEGDFNQALGL